MRLVLCDLSLKEYDVLILDEPTNHLDLVTKECLLSTLKDYKGAIIFISHDRYFINSLATHILFISQDETKIIEGNYDDFKEENDSSLLERKEEMKEKVEKPLVYDKLEIKNKLSNNKIKELKEKLKVIEEKLNDIDEQLSMDFEDYSIIDALNDEKSELEQEYFEILDILENNK